METKEIKPKATLAEAERLDFLSAKMKELNDEESQLECIPYKKEYYEYLEKYDWSDIVFEENGKKGLKNVKGEIVVPAIYDDFTMLLPYFNKSEIGAKHDGKVGLVKRDGKGTPVTPFEFQYIEPIYFLPIYAVWKPEDLHHFAIMAANTVITPYEIEDYDMPAYGIIPLFANGKKGLLIIDNLVYVKPEFDEILYPYGEECTFYKDGKKGSVTWDGRFLTDEDYDNLSEEEMEEVDNIGFIRALDWD